MKRLATGWAQAAIGWSVAASGAIVLVAWLVGIEPLRNLWPGLATMKFNTALAFIIAGAGLALHGVSGQPRVAGRVVGGLAALLIVLSTLTLLEYSAGVDLGIDEWLVDDAGSPGADPPGRMSVGTALGFLLVGLALPFAKAARRGRLLAAQGFAIATVALSGTALLGYLYDVAALYSVGLFSSMAVHTATLFLLLGAGLLLVGYRDGVMRVISSTLAGGRMLRRLLPVVLLLPVLLNWLALEGVAAGLYETEFALALGSLTSIGILAVVLWLSAHSLNRLHGELVDRQRESGHLAAIVEGSADAIVSTDLEGNITSWNAAAEQIYGYRETDMLGREFLRIVADPERDAALHTFHRVRRGDRVDHYETVVLDRGGQRIDVSLAASPIRDETGDLVGISTIAHDIREKKRADARFRATVEASPVGMILTDSLGGIELINAEASRLFGYDRDELLEQSIEVLVPERYRDRHPDYRGKFFEAPEARQMGAGRELFGLRRDGSEFPVEIGLRPFRLDDRWFVLSAVVDITERKRNERAH